MPTQNPTATAEEPKFETSNWTTVILAVAAVIAIIVAVFVVIKLRAKKPK
jgi:flagellar biogenesis protein FliO